jgi:hypothetical protein
MGQYSNELYARNYSLECENKSLQGIIAEFKNGQRYKKIVEDYGKVIAGYKRENQQLKKALAAEERLREKVRDIWFTQCDKDWEWYQSELEKKDKRIRELETLNWETLRDCDNKILEIQAEYQRQLKELKEESEKKDAIIEELKGRLAHAEALLNRDGTNSGTPTSQTPRNKTKRVPNSRPETERSKGGQDGHEKHDLEAPAEGEVTDTVFHALDDAAECVICGSNDLIYSGTFEDHYEYDVEVKVKKVRHRYYLYLCSFCGAIVKSAEGPDFRSQCQYGPGVQALALSLMNTVNAPINKVAMFLKGISGDELSPSEGFITKLQLRAAKGLVQFYADLRLKLITLSLLYWDDTVILINAKRACFRFYGDERIAYFTAHMQKGLKGLWEDNVLPMLTGDTKVMHDHNTVNYNPAFHFQNLECNQHLERDAQKNTDDTGHDWSLELKEHIAQTIHDQKQAKDAEKSCFEKEYVDAFNTRLDAILRHGWQEYEADKERLKKYGAPFERALLSRIEEYRCNYFAWVEDFTLPTTNNLSERSLRSIKSKLKIAGQFESEEYARYFAMIRTYIETCRRNDVNEIDALRRLCEGRPFTVDELFSKN